MSRTYRGPIHPKRKNAHPQKRWHGFKDRTRVVRARRSSAQLEAERDFIQRTKERDESPYLDG